MVFTILDISQLKKLMIVKMFTVWILSIYLLIMRADTLKKVANKYLIFDSTDENKELLQKYNDVWNGIKNGIKTINGGKEND